MEILELGKKKQTIESCLKLYIGDLKGILKGKNDILVNIEISCCNRNDLFSLEIGSLDSILRRKMIIKNDSGFAQEIELIKRSMVRNRFETLFVCPNCSGTKRALYLPKSKLIFMCSQCWNLTYESSQKANSKLFKLGNDYENLDLKISNLLTKISIGTFSLKELKYITRVMDHKINQTNFPKEVYLALATLKQYARSCEHV